MEILYFQLSEGESAKKYMWSQVKFPVIEVDMGKGGGLGCCLVPEYYAGNRVWKEEELTEKMNSVLTGGEWQEYYLHPKLCRMAGLREGFPPELLTEKLLARVPCWEYLFYIGQGRAQVSHRAEGSRLPEDSCPADGETWLWEDGDEECCRLLRLLGKYLPRINHFTLVADNPADYEAFTGFIYKEYGIPTACVKRIERRLGKAARTVVLDGRRNWRIPYEGIPEGAAYVDYWSVTEKKYLLEKMRRDVRYMSTVKFLDTLVKNGYNTIVN